MTLPRPRHVDLADFTDGYIRALAYAIDAQLGRASKVALLAPDAQATTDGNGLCWFQFPTLGQLSGAVIVPLVMVTAQGNVTSMPPVPPASIGRAIPATAVSLTLLSLNVGAVACRAMTTPWDNGVYQGQAQQYGSQPVKAGVVVRAAGIGWGPVV
jgi:hypothetical protein